MLKACVTITLLLVGLATALSPRDGASAGPAGAKKTCKTVVKKVHGKKKKVRVCKNTTPTPTPQPKLFLGPADVAVSPDGNVIVADQGSHRVLTLSPTGSLISATRLAGKDPDTFGQLYGVAVDPDGNVYLSDAEGHVIDKLAKDSAPLAQWSTERAEPDSFPTLLAVAKTGDVYVCDHTSRTVLHFAPDGTLVGSIGAGILGDPYGIAVGPDGNLYVVDFGDSRVRELSPSGNQVAVWGAGTNGTVALDSPEAIALDANGAMFVTEQHGRIVRFSRDGKLLSQWGVSGKLFYDPSGIALDAAGNVYVTEYQANLVDKLSPTGQVLAAWR